MLMNNMNDDDPDDIIIIIIIKSQQCLSYTTSVIRIKKNLIFKYLIFIIEIIQLGSVRVRFYLR